MNPEILALLNRWQRYAAFCGVAGLGLCVVGGFISRPQAARSYWFAWVFVAGVPFGALAMLTMHYLTMGAWGYAIRRPAEAAVTTLPAVAVLLLPALFVLPDIFPWAHREIFEGHQWAHRREYLTPLWFIIRTAATFLALTILGWLLCRGAAGFGPVSAKKLGALSGPGLVAYVFCINFSSTDWIMSIEPEWYSTMFAVIVIITQFLSALALSIVCVTLLADRSLSDVPLSPKMLHDLGNLLLAFVIFWAYVSFSQFLIIWSGNLPREISWYVHRRSGGWEYVAMFLALFQFSVPLALLLSRAAKRHAQRLRPIAALVAASTVVNVFWLIAPSYHPEGLRVHWLDVAALAGVGGIWLAAFLHLLKQRPLLEPLNEEVSHA